MGFFKDIADYFTNSDYLESKGVDTNNPLAVETEIDALKSNSPIDSSLSSSDFSRHQESVQDTGSVDVISEAIFGDSSSDSGFFGSSSSESSSDSGGGLFSDSSFFGDSDSDSSDSGGGWF